MSSRAAKRHAKPEPPRATLIIMVKEPRPGRVKTRLGRDIGHIRAAHWYRKQSLGMIRRLAHDGRWQVVLAVSPDTEARASRVWPAHIRRVAQGGGDLGHRMTRLLHQHISGGAVLIGSDIPGIRPAHIARAFAMLGNHDMVFGPATDGGFWLVGARRLPRRPFHGVAWSRADTLEHVRQRLQGTKLALVDTLSDVDTAADLP